MARFDVHHVQNQTGYLLNLQTRFLDHLPTHLVAPVLPLPTDLPAIRGLTVAVEIAGVPHLGFPQYLPSVPKRELGMVIDNLKSERDAITRRLDLLFTGL